MNKKNVFSDYCAYHVICALKEADLPYAWADIVEIKNSPHLSISVFNENWASKQGAFITYVLPKDYRQEERLTTLGADKGGYDYIVLEYVKRFKRTDLLATYLLSDNPCIRTLAEYLVIYLK